MIEQAASRRTVLIAAAALGLMAAAPRAPVEDGMVLGAAKARVTVVEYASVGCPHCGVWARETYPDFKRRFIDTGKVRFVFREMITGDGGLATAGFLTARCAARGKYFQVVDAIFADQQAFYEGGAYERLLAIAKNAGLSEDQFRTCLNSEAAKTALEARNRRASDAGVHSTPTFLVNGAVVEDFSLEALSAAIAKASAPAARRRR